MEMGQRAPPNEIMSINIKFTGSGGSARGFTLTEVVMAIALVALLTGGIISAYVQTTRRAEWAGYSLAAQALSLRQLEQARAARWDTQSSPPVDETVDIPSMSVDILDLPVVGDQPVWATNHFSLHTLALSSNPVVAVKVLRVDTVWPFQGRAYTNTTVTYRAPDR